MFYDVYLIESPLSTDFDPAVKVIEESDNKRKLCGMQNVNGRHN